MAYRIFRRTWWADSKCTIPRAGRKSYSGQVALSQDEARRICAENNRQDFGSPDGRGPRGAAWEFEILSREPDRAAYLGALLAARAASLDGTKGCTGRLYEAPSVHQVARDVTDLRRTAKALTNLAIADCNVGLTKRQENRRYKLMVAVAFITARYHWSYEASGDPRGCVVRVVDQNDERAGDGFGGGWPVY